MATSRRASRKPRIRVLEVLFRNVIRYAATRSFFSKLQQKDCAGSGSLPLCLHASVLFRCYSRRRIGGKPMHFPFPCAEGFSKMGEQFIDVEYVNISSVNKGCDFHSKALGYVA